jgi:hypothetical protein
VKALLHVHSDFSYDGQHSVESLAAWGEARGLDAIFLSEHVNGFDVLKMERMVAACDAIAGARCRLVPGLEFAVRGGFHVLGYHISAFRQLTELADVTRFVRDQGGLAVLAHPARYRGVWPDDGALAAMDGIEVWNARYDGRFLPAGDLLAAWADRCRSEPRPLAFGGQDLHALTSGRLVVTETTEARTVNGMVESMRSGAARFGARPFWMDAARPPRRSIIRVARGLHAAYRRARRLWHGEPQSRTPSSAEKR